MKHRRVAIVVHSEFSNQLWRIKLGTGESDKHAHQPTDITSGQYCAT